MNKKTYPPERVQLWKDMYEAGDSLNAIHYYESARGRRASATQVKRILTEEGVEIRTAKEQREIDKAKGTYSPMKYVTK